MKKLSLLSLASVALMSLTSCLGSDVENYDNWRKQNDDYIASIDLNEYERYIPSWAPEHAIYMKWHNDRALTAGNLVPISTSTVRVKYELEDIEGNKLQNSYKANGDSIYESQVNTNILGFWAALTNMHVGDSVTMILPYQSGYGNYSSGSVLPYSDLIYHVKLVSVKAYERPDK